MPPVFLSAKASGALEIPPVAPERAASTEGLQAIAPSSGHQRIDFLDVANVSALAPHHHVGSLAVEQRDARRRQQRGILRRLRRAEQELDREVVEVRAGDAKAR